MTENTTPWYKTLPSPQATARVLQPEEVAALIEDQSKVAGKDYIVIDVRRNDFTDLMVKDAINIPAQSIYHTRIRLAHALGNIPMVIFYCGSSTGRGTHCAGWFQDALNEIGSTKSEGIVLAGGIKGWVKIRKDLTEPVPSL